MKQKILKNIKLSKKTKFYYQNIYQNKEKINRENLKQFIYYICKDLNITPPKIYLKFKYILGFYSGGKIYNSKKYKLVGLCYLESNYIELYISTKNNKLISESRFKITLIHELIHLYDYYILKLKSNHTKYFFKRCKKLKRLLKKKEN